MVPSKQTTVYPMQVVEEITKRTLNGVETDYVLKAGTSDEKLISHKEIQGEIFETVDKARAVLTDRATRSVARLVDAAHKKAREWYPTAFPERVVQHVQEEDTFQEDNSPMTEGVVTLEDGTIARVKLPDILKS